MKQHIRWCTAILYLLLVPNVVWTQERALSYRYIKGEETKYQRTIRLQAESAANPEGKDDEVFKQIYTLRVEDVLGDGSARMTLRLDSTALWDKGKPVDLPPADTLRNQSVQFSISSVGHLLELEAVDAADAMHEALLSDVLIGISNRPALSGIVQEVGSTWKEDKEIQITHARVSVKARAAVTSRYARNELYRGIECARIEYNGILTIGTSRVGTMKGTLWFARATGQLIREAVERDVAVYTMRQGERVQWRIKEEEVVEQVGR
jgi:hypothetical protein